MKSIYRTLFILFIFAALASCDDEVIGERFDDNPNINAQFRVDINGETFVADQYGILTTEDGFTEIIGKRNDGAKVHLKVAGSGTDSYILNGSINGAAFYYDGVDPTPYDMTAIDTFGLLTITKYDISNGLGSGTFSFTAYREQEEISDTTMVDSTDSNIPPTINLPDTLEFTNGSFIDIPLNVEGFEPDPEDPIEIESNFHVELDDELYEAESIEANLTFSNGLMMNTHQQSKNLVVHILNPQSSSITLGGENAEGSISLIDSSSEEPITYIASSGTISISTIDLENNLISGTFTGTLANAEDDEDTISMTNGVFEDIEFESDIDQNNFMYANIGGNTFNTYEVNSEDAGGGIIAVTAVESSTNDQLQILLPASVNTGTYQVSNSAAFSAKYFKFDEESETTTEYKTVLNSGNIKILEKQGSVISGSFTFSVRNADGVVLQITQGEFKTDLSL